MPGRSRYTSNHEEIRRWVQERGGKPATVEGTAPEDRAGVLRIDFPGHGEDERFRHVDWDEWFRKFDENDLVMVVQDETASGMKSRFNKIVSRDAVERRRERSQADEEAESHGDPPRHRAGEDRN